MAGAVTPGSTCLLAAAWDGALTVNAFSVPDLVALFITGPILVVFVFRYFKITRQRTDLIAALVLACMFTIATIVLVSDNVVPHGVVASSIPGAAGRMLQLTRWQFAIGILALAATVHFALEYTQSARFAGWRATWLYLAALATWPIIWQEDFLSARTVPVSEFSSWKVAVPWQPLAGPLAALYGIAWFLAIGVVQYLLWLRSRPKQVQTSQFLRAHTVRIGLTVVAVSGITAIIEGLSGYTGVAIDVYIFSVGMIIVAGGLANEWKCAEQEREHVTRRFQSYVDPALVQYVLEHPEKARLDGEVRELTVVFTDLQDYTVLTDRLRERAVPLLNEYLSLMTPLIRESHGYRSKFLGDGIMFFYGAPEWDCDHAIQAVATALKMQHLMVSFNKQLHHRQLPTLNMRIGISSGEMIVGDAGSEEASDYTVLGGAVNLGARLEVANKFTGTRILVSERTAALLPRDLILLRPIGKLLVTGFSQPVMTYEPVGFQKTVGASHRAKVELTQAMVEAFQRRDFRACLDAESRLREGHGASTLNDRYRQLSEGYLAQPPPADFAGEIHLSVK